MTTTTTTTDTSIIERAARMAPEIRASAAESERLRTLAPTVVERLREEGLFDIALPRAFGGGEADMATILRAFEEVAIADGAAGWCLMIAAGTAFNAGFVPEAVAREMFAPGVLHGGPIAPTGQLVPADGGYRLSGRWSFASGVRHCEWIWCGAMVMDGAAPRMLAEGMPDWRLAVVPAGALEVIDTWHVSGLRGTGSHDIAISDFLVPEGRTLAFLTAPPLQPGTLYRIPIASFFAMIIASVGLGIARRSLDELVELAQTKVPLGAIEPLRERATVHDGLAHAEAGLRAARGWLFESARDAWATAERGDAFSIEQRALVRLAAAHATDASVRAAECAYRLGGSGAMYDASALQRCLRDVYAVSQHILANQANYQMAGRIMMGLPTDALVL